METSPIVINMLKDLTRKSPFTYITYWKSDIFLVKVQGRFMLMEHQTIKTEQIWKLLQIIPRKCLNKL